MSMKDLIKDVTFIELINKVMNKQGDLKSINFFSYIAPKIGFDSKGYAQVKNMLVPYENKFLKLDQFFIILDNLNHELQKELLDYIANKYDFNLSYSATASKSNDSIKDLLLSFSVNNGDIVSSFFDFNSDGCFDKSEKEQLKMMSYMFRSRLIEFENSLKEC